VSASLGQLIIEHTRADVAIVISRKDASAMRTLTVNIGGKPVLTVKSVKGFITVESPNLGMDF
jgi:hypothetical protein